MTPMSKHQQAGWLALLALAIAPWSPGLTTLLFGVLSFLALRQEISAIPTQPAEHPALAVAFYLILPLQYLLLGSAAILPFCLLIPLFLLLTVARSREANAPAQMLQIQTVQVRWLLLFAVYGLSHLPALLFSGAPSPLNRPTHLVLVFAISFITTAIQQGTRPAQAHPRLAWLATLTVSALSGTLFGQYLGLTTTEAVILVSLTALAAGWGALTVHTLTAPHAQQPPHTGILHALAPLCCAGPVYFHLCRYLGH